MKILALKRKPALVADIYNYTVGEGGGRLVLGSQQPDKVAEMANSRFSEINERLQIQCVKHNAVK